MGRTLLLTGRPRTGKTTLIKAVTQQLGNRAGGFYTEEILGPGGRKGFRLITLDGRSVVMAHVDIRSRSKVGRYGVDVGALERVGVAALVAAIEQKPIVIIDEIGKMELFSPQFQSAVVRAVGSSKIVLASVMRGNHPWIAALQSMPAVTTWEVTSQNREALVGQVLAWLRPDGL
jgi:nucleoside-triphosphatase